MIRLSLLVALSLCAEVWLVQAPENVQQCVRDVAVLAAVSAMECGRRFMAAAQKGESALSPGPVLLERAITRAVATLCSRLRGFAALGLLTTGWGLVGPRHPFLRLFSGGLECSWSEELHMVDCLSTGCSARFQVCFARLSDLFLQLFIGQRACCRMGCPCI